MLTLIPGVNILFENQNYSGTKKTFPQKKDIFLEKIVTFPKTMIFFQKIVKTFLNHQYYYFGLLFNYKCIYLVFIKRTSILIGRTHEMQFCL